MVSGQLPFPSFEDVRKILNFWIDQQDKWFYFETEKWKSGSQSSILHLPPVLEGSPSPMDDNQESTQYALSRIIGKIRDILSFPPSLLLEDTTVFTVLISFDNFTGRVVSLEKRKEYGLVFSQVAYYEPIHDIKLFFMEDPRVRYKISKQRKS